MVKYIKLTVILFTVLGLVNCKPKLKELSTPATASFEAVRYLDPSDPDYNNAYIFRNTTPGSYYYLWDFGGVESSFQNVDTVFLAYKGTYQIKLTAASAGGTSTTVQDLVIPSTSPFAAEFSLEKVDDFHYKVKVTTPGTVARTFRFPNGETSTNTDSAFYFPFKGTHDVKLTVTTPKGAGTVSSTIVKKIEIPNDDVANPEFNDNVFKLLTGGLEDVDGKTWVMSPAGIITGVGPYKKDAMDVSYWAYPNGYADDAAWATGALTNSFTFIMRNYQYKPGNQNVTANYLWVREKFGVPSQAKYADAAQVDKDHKAAPFVLRKDGTGITGYSLKFTDGTYMAYYDNRYNYEIAKITADSLFVRHTYNDTDTDPNHNDPKFDANQRILLFTVKK